MFLDISELTCSTTPAATGYIRINHCLKNFRIHCLPIHLIAGSQLCNIGVVTLSSLPVTIELEARGGGRPARTITLHSPRLNIRTNQVHYFRVNPLLTILLEL